MRLAIASDTHNRHERVRVPDGDVFVHCGDFTLGGSLEEIGAFGSWVRTLPHARKIVIAGNHDWGFEREPAGAREALGPGIDYLQDDAVTIGGVRFWGSPWQPWFMDWAFNLERGPQLAAKWALIPAETDVLVTHGPPRGILDRTLHGDAAGCDDLAARLRELRVQVHAFGHIHEESGIARVDDVTYVNASICDVRYRPVNPVRVVDVTPGTSRRED